MSGRMFLPHQPPWRVDSAQELFFVTICCRPRGLNQLAKPDVGDALFETIAWRNSNRVWYAHLFLLMPDHCHAVMSFPDSEHTIKQRISFWKKWVAMKLGIVWQRDFFDHRSRSDESWREKADYILANPVRAGFVEQPEHWPYLWFPPAPDAAESSRGRAGQASDRPTLWKGGGSPESVSALAATASPHTRSYGGQGPDRPTAGHES
jgi:putative transposase